ncbi:LysR family transcriptional regulator [Cronobacter turicensis]|uniref:LysR family transcriptional regulator n=1 Tax=unclassified Cronobacter TaxID=2649764 RepID=UPI0013EA87B3|nr:MULTISPECIES: LysR family transcriptional regulator [unclassified Cronobacter]ELQ6223482.1 LysR family transcriptional regulator [Cronobacter turicensis]KAF6593363.1 LysR family transcriptional regulator [Cronobacter sp. EKM101R]KAF6595743.1 LysR family transcriptional regulator [Cronobacter sp. EKM102R]
MKKKNGVKEFDYNLIKVLDAVITAGNATRASRQLQVTPAAITLAIQRLQQTYNEELFIRTREGLTPTPRAHQIHRAYSRVLDMIDATFEHDVRIPPWCEMKITGDDVSEQYYFSQLFDMEVFDRLRLHYASVTGKGLAQQISDLKNGNSDLLIATHHFSDPDIEQIIIDQYRNYTAVCHVQNPLCELSQLSLANIFSSRHAVYHPYTITPLLKKDIRNNESFSFFNNHLSVGYNTDSINGLLSIIENSSMVAILPEKIARFFQTQGKYRIALISLPDAIEFETIKVYANWYRSNPQRDQLRDVIAMLQTLINYRK